MTSESDSDLVSLNFFELKNRIDHTLPDIMVEFTVEPQLFEHFRALTEFVQISELGIE